jgi:glycosyltransferase involved in cell wall biosynthesis
VKFIEHKFENYTSQRNFAIDQAKNKWILFIYADVRLTPELKLEILETIQNQPAYSAYLVYRTFMFKNKVLRFSGWQTDSIFRLFDKEKARYTNKRLVHEKLDVIGEISFLKNKLIHYSYNDYKVYKGKMESYGKLKAIEAKNKGIKPNAFHFYIKPAYKFLYQYLIRSWILDGKKGITICYLNAFSVYVRFQELKKLNSRV